MDERTKTPKNGADRAARLERALRTNLAKRKAQARMRKSTGEPPQPEPGQGRPVSQDPGKSSD